MDARLSVTLRSRRFDLQFTRSVLMLVTTGMLFFAVSELPRADCMSSTANASGEVARLAEKNNAAI